MALDYQEYYTTENYKDWAGDWELFDGMPYAMTPSPSVTHQTVAVNIIAQIKFGTDNRENNCAGCNVLMETDWQVSNDTVVRPDIMVICQDIEEEVIVTPEVIVEVVSSSSTKRDEVMKFELYQKEGVQHYVLAYPEKRLAKVYLNRDGMFGKQGEYSADKLGLQIGACAFEINFRSVWR